MNETTFRELLANDGYAATFQTMGQYRTALLAAFPKQSARAPLPVPTDIMEARTQGRAEALAIILGLSAEEGLDEYTISYSIGDTGDYGSAWDEDKLRELLRADDAAWSLMQEAEGEYWHNLGLREEADRLYAVASAPWDALKRYYPDFDAKQVRESRCGAWVRLDDIFLLSQQVKQPKPTAWVCYGSDGRIEGPIMDNDSRMCDTRRSFWTPLYASPAAAKLRETPATKRRPLEAFATVAEWAAQEGDCKCRRLGDWNGEHHPLCDDAAPSASAQQAEPVAWIDRTTLEGFANPQNGRKSTVAGLRRADEILYSDVPLYVIPTPSASPPALTDDRLEALPWHDTSTANPVEKARRVLGHLIKPSAVYFFEDGFPRNADIAANAQCVLAVLDHLAASPAAPTGDEAQLECERCGLPPEKHTYAHWCDCQYFCPVAPAPSAAQTPTAATPQSAAQDARDAARWRELLLHVTGTFSGRAFAVPGVTPVPGANIMQGSVAQHFADAIDAMSASKEGESNDRG